MKDLILITSYCNNYNKLDILRNLVNQIKKHDDMFDIMIVSHTCIPMDIQKKVNLYLYDEKNEILKDPDLVNQPWFEPDNGRRIQSTLFGGNSHLALWRMMIMGFSLAKNIGYQKVHHIEYDSSIDNIGELKENSLLLDTYNSVYYMDDYKEVDENILFGSFQSYKINKLHPMLLDLDEDKIKNMIRNSSSKSPENMLKKLLHEMGNFYEKKRTDLETEENMFGLSINLHEDTFVPWGIPYVDYLDDNIYFFVRNDKKNKIINYKIIVNNNKILTMDNITPNMWSYMLIGHINDVNHIVTIENNIIRNIIDLSNQEEKDKLYKHSFRHN